MYSYYGNTEIYNIYAIQVFPTSYPTEASIAYIAPLISTFMLNVNGQNKIEGSTIWMTKNGSLSTTNNNIYKDSNNPITCKYWYISM